MCFTVPTDEFLGLRTSACFSVRTGPKLEVSKGKVIKADLMKALTISTGIEQPSAVNGIVSGLETTTMLRSRQYSYLPPLNHLNTHL